MKRSRTWVVVADGARAQVFLNSGPKTGLKSALPQALVADNRPSGELVSDRSGRSFDSTGQGRHAMEQSSDPHEHQQKIFALEIAKLLDQKRNEKAYDQIIIVATPKMLGTMRQALNKATSQLVVGEINKDLTKSSVDELSAHLDDLIKL